MKRVLDELAEAIHTAQGQPHPRVIVTSIEMLRQFSVPMTPHLWHALAAKLTCFLPPLRRRADGPWLLPSRCRTIWQLAAIAAQHHPDWEPPCRYELADWREAQVFVGVRASLVDALNVEPDEVVRTARLQTDLGAT